MSMTQEKAKEILSDWDLCHYTPSKETAEVIISAIDPLEIISALRGPTREQVERMRGEWIIGEPDGLGTPIHCSRCGWGSDHADQRKWIEYNGHLFCGHCGAPMTDEAVDMMVRRWKEAVDGEAD